MTKTAYGGPMPNYDVLNFLDQRRRFQPKILEVKFRLIVAAAVRGAPLIDTDIMIPAYVIGLHSHVNASANPYLLEYRSGVREKLASQVTLQQP